LLRRARRATPIRQRLADKLGRQARALQAWTSSEPASQLEQVPALGLADQLVRDAVAALQLARELVGGETQTPARGPFERAGLPQTPGRAQLLALLAVAPQSAEQLASELKRDRRAVQRDLDQLARHGLVVFEREDGAWHMRL
jgi:hypothetical protein